MAKGKKPRLGSDLYGDIRIHLPQERINLCFDVGANTGQTVREICTNYPESIIFTFEPDADTFQRLLKNTHGNENIRPFNIGFSSKSGISYFSEDKASDRRHVTSHETGKKVTLETLDQFCTGRMITKIDLLKIDTEGHDLEVLRGASQLLRDGGIGVVVAECSMNIGNKYHSSFFGVYEFLSRFGYMPFGIYEQVSEWPTKQPILRRANVAFVAPLIILRNTGR